jgi:nucleotide-binding universal stress UspA family protein
MVGQLVLKAPVPVLVVPDHVKKLDVHAPVLVGWNGSSEACVALRSAVPLLTLASKVYLAVVEEKRGQDRFDFPAMEGAKYLSRHGIEAEIVEIPRGEARVSDTLFSGAQMRECSMLVMGAYGHSRIRQLLLGSTTTDMLRRATIPILLLR